MQTRQNRPRRNEPPAVRGVSYPLSPVLPLQIANASLVCNLRPGGISISLRPSLNRPRKPLRFSWIFPAIFETAQIFWRCTYKLRRGRCRSQPFATKERYGCGSAACRYTSARQNAPYFTGIFGEFVTSQWADRVVGPYGKASTAYVSRRGGRLCPPAGYTGFTAIFGEFATSQRADVSIGPYKTLANPHCPANLERKAFLPQILNRSCSQICCTVTGGAQYSARRVSLCVRNN